MGVQDVFGVWAEGDEAPQELSVYFPLLRLLRRGEQYLRLCD